jgi:hypothetical protein
MAKPHLELIEWLKGQGAHTQKHSGRTLLAHLESTHSILVAAGCTEVECNAGLFHSVYGTGSFKTQLVTLEQRATVTDLIGTGSEQIAWLFCVLERSKAFPLIVAGDATTATFPLHAGGVLGADCIVSTEALHSLLTIEAANLLDQNVLWRSQWLIPHAKRTGVLTSEGQGPVPFNQTHQGAMIEQAKLHLLQMLANRVNEKRHGLASAYWWGDNLRVLKTVQAQQIVQANGECSEHVDCRLVVNYAEVNGLSLLDAANSILEKAVEFQELLIESEMHKDRMAASIGKATCAADITRIRTELTPEALPKA